MQCLPMTHRPIRRPGSIGCVCLDHRKRSDARKGQGFTTVLSLDLIRLLEDCEDLAESGAEVADRYQVDSVSTVRIALREGVSIRKEYVGKLLLVMGAYVDAEEREIRRTQKHAINRQRANGLVVAVVAQIIELDMFGREYVEVKVIHRCNARVPVVVTTLSL